MFQKIRKNPSFTGIATSATATVSIPARGTLYGIVLEAKDGATLLTAAQVKADITMITLELDGDTKIQLSATELIALQEYYGASLGANEVPGHVYIPLVPYWMPNSVERNAFAYGLHDVDNVTLKIDCNSTLTMDTVNVYLARTEEPRVLGQHITMKGYPQNFGTTGEHEVSTLPKADGSKAIRAMHVTIPGSSTISAVSVDLEGVTLFDEVPAGANQIMLERQGRTPQSGFYHVDAGRDNSTQDLIPMGVQDFRVTPVWATAAPTSYRIILEQIEGLKVR